MKHNLLRRLPFLICFILYAMLSFAAFSNTHAISLLYPTTSLRYLDKITQEQALKAREYAVHEQENSNLWPTFWNEYSAKAQTSLQEEKPTCVEYWGDGSLVWPANFTRGTYPGELDSEGCAVSSQMAWKLWGSFDIIGMEIEIDGNTRVVRGVFEDKDPIALLSQPMGSNAGWRNVEISGTFLHDIREESKTFAQDSGLATPDSLLIGTSVTALAQIASVLPLVLLILIGGISLVQLARRISKRTGTIALLCFTSLILIAAFWGINNMPASLIPSRWSNFAFWSEFIKKTETYINDWFALIPFMKDTRAKWLFGKQFAFFFFMILLLFAPVLLLISRQRDGGMKRLKATT